MSGRNPTPAAAPIAFDREADPTVSVVMVTYGAWPWVHRSLEALRSNTGVPIEVIVVDNASPDGTAEHLRTVRGITLIHREKNVGFGAGCNLGALQARAPFLCLLNSDTMVRAGWLEPLLRRLGDPAVGAAVSSLVELDGTVQDAGSLLGAGGVSLAYGRGRWPDDPSVCFPRTIDYGSGACMVMRRRDFAAVGGFHPDYGIGYCEDVDLCLELSARGLRTVYEPRSLVVHVGAASSDHTEAGRRIVENRSILRRRWGDLLDLRPPLEDVERYPHRLLAARDAVCLDRILLLSAGPIPAVMPPLAAALGRRLAGESRVTVAHAGDVPARITEELLAAGVEVVSANGNLDALMRARRFHTTAVVALGPAATARFGASIAETQPQALRGYWMAPRDPGPSATGLRNETECRTGEVAWLRECDVVVCDSPAEVRLVGELAPAARCVPSAPAGGLEEWLPLFLAPLGVVADPVERSAPSSLLS